MLALTCTGCAMLVALADALCAPQTLKPHWAKVAETLQDDDSVFLANVGSALAKHSLHSARVGQLCHPTYWGLHSALLHGTGNRWLAVPSDGTASSVPGPREPAACSTWLQEVAARP